MTPDEIRVRRAISDTQPLTLRLVMEIPGSNVYTTGKLEWALHQGLTVYVITPQPSLRAEDEWWIPTIPESQILLGPPYEANDEYPHLRPWFKLLDILGIPTEGVTHGGEATDRIRDRVIFGNQIVR